MAQSAKGTRGALVTIIAAGLLAVGCSPAPPEAPAEARAAKPAGPPEVSLEGVACLATQWYPDATLGDPALENRLLREIVRQGVLVAAREELGLVTRDETLGEPFPEGAEPLEVWLRAQPSGAWEARLFGAGAPRDKPVWEHEGQLEFDKRTLYAQAAAEMTRLGETIAERLRAAGAAGEAQTLNPDNVPPAGIEERLCEMNFVSQYAAVRAAHQAMADGGPSLAWMDVLVRGYAHLALLTEHLWSSQHEAFAARSLLYAERMARLAEDDPLAPWRRAYALALIGAHGAAIEQLDAIAQDDGEGEQTPAWTRLVSPYVNFKHEELRQVGRDYPELNETVARLQWGLYRSYMHGRWAYEKGVDAMRGCPEAYGVYSAMANWSALMISRLGSGAGMRAFGERLPMRVGKLDGLPEAAEEFTRSTSGPISRMLGAYEDPTLSDRPMKIAKVLSEATRDAAAPREASWAILAALIAEEQFVEVADMLKVSGNAVEYSKASIVDRVLPLVEGHRYAPYIRSYAARTGEREKRAEALSEVKLVDPRANMKSMFYKAWRDKIGGLTGYALTLRAYSHPNFTLPGLLESYYRIDSQYLPSARGEVLEAWAGDFERASPRSPNAVRLRWETPEKVEAAKLAEWEKQLGDDPVGWMTIASRYHGLEDVESATRAYQRSVDISPSYDATVGLANAHYDAGRQELWQPTLETYLEVEDLSLAHAQIHQLIANENIRKRAWKEAEPHAVAAAQTYSAWGLGLAARVYEGARDWEKSEHFRAEAARSYPSSYMGSEWYFWCRRTGRGDVDAAKQLAQRSIAVAADSSITTDIDRMFTYRVLEGDTAEAIAEMNKSAAVCTDENKWHELYRLLHTALWAVESDDASRRDEELKRIGAFVDTKITPDWPAGAGVYEKLGRALAGEELDDAALEAYDKSVSEGDAHFKCNYRFFMGTALAAHGHEAHADRFMRLAAFGGPFENNCATLAGARLVEKHGPERGGLPDKLARLEAEAAKALAKADAQPDDERDAEDADAETQDRSL